MQLEEKEEDSKKINVQCISNDKVNHTVAESTPLNSNAVRLISTQQSTVSAKVKHYNFMNHNTNSY